MTKRQATARQNEILKLFFVSNRRGPAQVLKTTYKKDYSEMNFQIQELARINGKDQFFDIGHKMTFEEMKKYLAN